MPSFETFETPEAYYATLGHEITSLDSPSRGASIVASVARRWGDEGYAQEELVAELGAAFLAADLNLVTGTARRARVLYRALAPVGSATTSGSSSRLRRTRRRLSTTCMGSKPNTDEAAA